MATYVSRQEVNDTVPFINLTLLNEDPIGAGAFGKVYKALHKEWGCQVAFKKLGVTYITAASKQDQMLVFVFIVWRV